jgi:DNA-binding SARP family transcriptional activator/streptogramin lyase
MEFRILGPVEVVRDGRTVALGSSKQRALLVILLLHVNEVVSRDRLIEDLWGERAPETAATALHGYVSQLRKVLEPEGAARRLLVTRAPGYLLELDPAQVDLKRFELLARRGRRELAAGDAEAAAVTLAEALSLWRGPPLAEFSSSVPFVAESLRLQELMVSTLEDRIEADLGLERHEELVWELEELVAEHPFRERLCGQLMLALYRCGRQADALEFYRRTRRRLVEELGIEPSPALQELERAILRHEEAIAAPPAPSRSKYDPLANRYPKTPSAAAPAIAEQVPRRPRHPVRRWPVVATVVAAMLAVALGLVFALRGQEQASLRLAPNSVGFIDATSGRVTRSFPVGRAPSAIAVADGSVWVANYEDGTVTRINRTTGKSVTIPVRGHPTGVAAFRSAIWVWTLEDVLVPIDPRYDSAGNPVSLANEVVGARSAGGRITVGGGFVWIAAPPTTVIRVDAATAPYRRLPIVPDEGVQGAISYLDGQVWVAGAYEVFPIVAKSGIAGTGANVGVVHDLAFGADSLWVASGGPGHVGGVVQALRRVDAHTRLVQATIAVGSNPVAVASAGGSIWVASQSDGAIERVDPEQNRVVERIPIGSKPTALIADGDGVWVAVQ